MEEYITKKDDVLTRVTLEINGETYEVESVYSDSNLIELAMQCVEGFVAKIGAKRENMLETIKCMLLKKETPCPRDLFVPTEFTFTFEQYDKRNTVKINSVFNIVESLVNGIRACSVIATWMPETVDDFFVEYLDGSGIEVNLEDVEKDSDEEDNETDEDADVEDNDVEENKENE